MKEVIYKTTENADTQTQLVLLQCYPHIMSSTCRPSKYHDTQNRSSFEPSTQNRLPNASRVSSADSNSQLLKRTAPFVFKYHVGMLSLPAGIYFGPEEHCSGGSQRSSSCRERYPNDNMDYSGLLTRVIKPHETIRWFARCWCPSSCIYHL